MPLPFAPGPKPTLPWTNLLRLRKDALGFLSFLHGTYGDVVRYRMGPRHFHLVNHPDLNREVLVVQEKKVRKGIGLQRAKVLLGEGLLTSEGEAHLQHRRMMQPAFHHRKIATYADLMVRHTMDLRQRLGAGEVLDLNAEMTGLTLAIVAEALFGADLRAESGELGEALTTVIGSFNALTNPFAGVMMRLPLPSTRRIEGAIERLNRTIFRVIENRRKAGEEAPDLLSMLLHAQDDEGAKEKFTDAQVRDETMTLFLAGHETTANALTWTWHLLALNPEAEARFHAELDAVLGGRAPGFEDVPKLKMTEAVFAESMRLLPPVWGFGREVLEELELGGCRIEPGDLIILSPWVMHRDARWWPEPLRFDLDRHLGDAKAGRNKFTYFPFSHGPRNCIGEPFAWMEGILLLATLAQAWRFRPVEGRPVVLDPLFTLRPRHGLWMKAEARI
jgi:cytochrome P450